MNSSDLKSKITQRIEFYCDDTVLSDEKYTLLVNEINTIIDEYCEQLKDKILEMVGE